ncbi:MAG: hypothetical protein RLZZ20_2162 [Pseudomonadota bacterium]
MPDVQIHKTSQISFLDYPNVVGVVTITGCSTDEELEGPEGAPASSVEISTPDGSSEQARSSEQAHAKPTCPKPVHYIINALSVAGTFGGLALIITGGTGTTLHEPSDNPIVNGAMLLSGGALLAGSFLGGLYHMSGRAPAQ